MGAGGRGAGAAELSDQGTGAGCHCVLVAWRCCCLHPASEIWLQCARCRNDAQLPVASQPAAANLVACFACLQIARDFGLADDKPARGSGGGGSGRSRKGDGGAASLNGSSDADNARDPQLGGSLDNGFDVSGEIREIEMGVSVDDQAELAAGPRCAGSEAIC